MNEKITDATNFNANTTMVFLTCDKYSELWPFFFGLLYKQWPAFSLPIVSTAETKSFITASGLHVYPINCKNSNLGWSDRLYLALKNVKTKYVMLFIDDFFLKDTVNTKKIYSAYDILQSHSNIGAVFFAPFPGKGKEVGLTDYVQNRKFSTYQLNLQISLLSKKYLISTLRKGETPWEFELYGSFRSMFANRHYLAVRSTDCSPFSYDYGFVIIRGMYNEKVCQYFKDRYGFDLSHSSFPPYDPSKSKQRHHHKLFYLIKAIQSLFKEKYE